MGDIWLADLPVVVAAAGLDVECWPGWETRCRGSGGYTHVWAVFAHHTASSTSRRTTTRRTCGIRRRAISRSGRSCWTAPARCGSGRPGRRTVKARAARIRRRTARSRSIRATRTGSPSRPPTTGTGEPWPIAQQTAYVTLCKALCDAYGMDPTRDICAHFEWTDRKIDPAGPSDYATGSDSWDMDMFRADCAACDLTTNGDGDDDVTDDDMQRIADLVWQRSMTFTPTGTTVDAETMLEYAAAYACLAQQQTTDER